MRAVYKYQLARRPVPQRLTMSRGAEILRVEMQDDRPTIWALYDSHQPTETRYFQIFGTGQPLPEFCTYRGTVFDDLFVWHVFEVPA